MIPAAASSFLLPVLSRREATLPLHQLFGFCLLCATTILTVLSIFGFFLMDDWFQSESELSNMFFVLSLGFFIYSFAIIPYHFLSSRSDVLTLAVCTLLLSSLFLLVISSIPVEDISVRSFLWIKNIFLILSSGVICGLFFWRYRSLSPSI